MELLFEVAILFLFHWRTALVTAISMLIAVTLATLIPSFPGSAGVVLVCIGVGVGILWEGSAKRPAAQTTGQTELNPDEEISWPVAILGLAFFGALIGGWASELAGSVIGGAAILLFAVAAVGFYQAKINKRPIPLRSLIISACCLLTGLASLAIFVPLLR